MELRILWTDTARFQLEDIFDYYKVKASKKVATKIVKQIVEKVKSITKHPKTGQIEEALIERLNSYRYLVDGNYKIIYWIEDNYIKIAAVFDCRQDPKKLKLT